MSWAMKLIGWVTGNGAEVDANNRQLVNMPMTATAAGYQTLSTELDSGEIIGTRNMRQPISSVFNRLATGRDTLIFSDYFTATAQNSALWKMSVTTFTFGVGTGGYIVFNNGAVTTTGASQLLQSYRTFPLFSGAPFTFEFSELRSVVTAANQQAEAGIFLAAATPFTPTDGIYFRFNSNGLFGVLCYNTVETSVQLLTAGAMIINDNTTFRIVVDHYRIEFWGTNATADPRVLLGVIPVPSANGPPFSAVAAPIAFRLFNSGTAGSATQWKIANASVYLNDFDMGKPWPHTLAGMGLIAAQGQNGGTMGSTAAYGNSLAPGAGAALTNTAAVAGGTGLGGQVSVQPTLVANTDGILFTFQNPAGSVTQQPRTLYITGVRINGVVTTAFTGGPVLYFYSLAFGHTAASMATTDGASGSSATKAPRRIPLGFENYIVTAGVGQLPTGGVNVQFTTPIPVNAGEFVAICAKNVGTVTSAGVVTVLAAIDGYFE